MTNRDDGTPRPTDPTIDPIAGQAAQEADTDDTEGHSLLSLELGRTIARDRMHEADRIARDSARVREAGSRDKGGFFKRLGRPR